MYFSARNEIIKMLSSIEKREECLDSIRNVVLGMKEDSNIEERKSDIKSLAKELMEITKTISNSIDDFVKSFKQFGKTFVYDQMVRILMLYCRIILK